MKGQGSLETVAVFAGILFAITIIAAFLVSSSNSSVRIHERQVALQSVQALSAAADQVYLAGDGATRQVWVSIPESVEISRSFIGSPAGTGNWSFNKTIDLYLSGIGDAFATANAPLCGSWPAEPGRYELTLTYNSSSIAHVAVNDSC